MIALKNVCWIILILVLTSLWPVQRAAAAPPQPAIPEGFRLVTSDTGVELYRKDYSEGTPDFVQVVDLNEGASLRLMYGNVTEPRPGKGVYGGNDARVARRSLQQFWNQLSSENGKAFCVTNGQFFYMPEDPPRLPFPLKVDGDIITDGYGINDYPGLKLMLELYEDRANIVQLSRQSLYTSTAPNIVAGLDEDANKRAKKYVARTFVGLDDRDRDGRYETIFIFNTQTARQVDAAEVLRSFGAKKVMMLDGGGSTQLLCQGKNYIPSERLIPQAIGIVAAVAPRLAMEVVSQPVMKILIPGEGDPVEIQVKNTGSQTWRAGEMQLILDRSEGGYREKLALQQDTPPGETAVFVWRMPAFSTTGVQALQWALSTGPDRFPEEAVQFQVISLPVELQDRKAGLEKQLTQWETQKVRDVSPLVKGWIEEQSRDVQISNLRQMSSGPVTLAGPPRIEMAQKLVEQAGLDLSAIFWIPAAIFPVALLVLMAVLRIRRSY